MPKQKAVSKVDYSAFQRVVLGEGLVGNNVYALKQQLERVVSQSGVSEITDFCAVLQSVQDKIF